jgi:hypothetical protein
MARQGGLWRGKSRGLESATIPIQLDSNFPFSRIRKGAREAGKELG